MRPAHATLLFLAAALLLAGRPARADGGFVPRFKPDIDAARRHDISEPTQKAIILFDAGREDLLLQARYDGPAEDFGWLVPVPGKPTVERAPIECFYELSLFYQWRTGQSKVAAGPGAAKPPAITVVEQKTVGAYTIAVLEAGDADALTQWLAQNGYHWPAGHREILDHYVQQRWYWVAIRVGARDPQTQRALSSGELHPLQFSFDTPRCIYPLKISAINPGRSAVTIYTLSLPPLTNPHMMSDPPLPYEPRWDRDLSWDGRSWACVTAIPRLAGGPANGRWALVRHSFVFYPPMMDDLVFEPESGTWRGRQLEFLRWYATAGMSAMLAEPQEHSSGYEPTEYENILGRLKWLSDAAPELVPACALEFLKAGRYDLLRALSFRKVNGPMDDLARQAARTLANSQAERSNCWELLGAIGYKAGPALPVLAQAAQASPAFAGDLDAALAGNKLQGIPMVREQMAELRQEAAQLSAALAGVEAADMASWRDRSIELCRATCEGHPDWTGGTMDRLLRTMAESKARYVVAAAAAAASRIAERFPSEAPRALQALKALKPTEAPGIADDIQRLAPPRRPAGSGPKR